MKVPKICPSCGCRLIRIKDPMTIKGKHEKRMRRDMKIMIKNFIIMYCSTGCERFELVPKSKTKE